MVMTWVHDALCGQHESPEVQQLRGASPMTCLHPQVIYSTREIQQTET